MTSLEPLLLILLVINCLAIGLAVGFVVAVWPELRSLAKNPLIGPKKAPQAQPMEFSEPMTPAEYAVWEEQEKVKKLNQ